MPIYDAKCKHCGNVEFVSTMADVPAIGGDLDCPKCDGPAIRIASGVSTDMVDNERLSTAMSLHPQCLKNGYAQKHYPGAEWKIQNGVAKMVIHNRKEKVQRMKQMSVLHGTEYGD